jgi:hypothetical protein
MPDPETISLTLSIKIKAHEPARLQLRQLFKPRMPWQKGIKVSTVLAADRKPPLCAWAVNGAPYSNERTLNIFTTPHVHTDYTVHSVMCIRCAI